MIGLKMQDKYILNGIEYDNYRQYNQAYNNLIRENMMASYKKDLKDIPVRQKRIRPNIRYRTINYCSSSERWHKIFAYVFAYLGGFTLFVMAFVALLLT
jgi:hypothetical protein